LALARTLAGLMNSEFSNTVGPPKEPSNILMGVKTNRGPISVKETWGGPAGWRGSFSMIYIVSFWSWWFAWEDAGNRGERTTDLKVPEPDPVV
jgi:hypothetical protein